MKQSQYSIQNKIERILQMISKIEKYTENITDFEDFQKDEKTVDAIITPLTQIGETVGSIEKYNISDLDLEYREIIGFRNILVHMYHKIDLKVIRKVINTQIPKLKEKLLKYIGK